MIMSGRVRKGDIWVDYANAGSMTQLSFSFMLQNSIDENDYIKISLPFPLHSSLVPAYPATQGLSLPSGLIVTYQYVDNSANIQSTIYTCQALTQTIDSSNYFIRFYNTDRKTLIPIPKLQWFYLKFKIQQTDPLQYQKSSSILQIQISTVSSTWANAMIYDDNLAFNYFQLAPAPTKSITLQTTPYSYTGAGGYLLTQAVYNIYLDISMNIASYQFQQNLKLLFFISKDNTFIWSGLCSSIAKNNAPTIAQLDVSLYTCTVDTVKNIMTVVLTPAALAKQTSYRFTVGIKNPPIVIKDIDIIVKAIKQVSNVILSYGIDISALNTNQIYIIYQQIFIGWGLRPDALLPFDARIFRGNSATPTYMPYNSLNTKFQISQTTSTTTQLKIQISIPSQSGAFVLSNGYTHNLPSFPNKQVYCVVQYITDTVKRKIVCTGIGSLLATKVYYIGWKMFFPYDNYQSDIDCTKFGLITVYSAEMISAKDNLFILGRGNAFLSYMKNSPDYYVIGRNSSYISYMKTFINLNMMVLSSDFQQFLKLPQQIIVNNRPDTYTNKIYNDVYVIGQNLAFMTYLQQFNDLYIAYRLKNTSDITKSYLTIPLIATSMPKNTLIIKTCNSKDWTDYITNTNPLISSIAATNSRTVTQGLRSITGTNQSLVFSMKAPYAQVTSTSSANVGITDNWGMLIMLNPKIKINGSPLVLSQSSASLSVTGQTINTVGSYNNYTLITLKGSTTESLQTTFPLTPAKTIFSLFPLLIQDISSIYADQNNMDIMIATVDGIDGPLNKMKFNGYFLINSFTMMNTAQITTVNSGMVAYSYSNYIDGSQVPTMLRIKGTLPVISNFNTLNLYFDYKIQPFFSNYYSGDIYCKTTDTISKCRYIKGVSSSMIAYDYLNYMKYSRFQIKLTSPTTSFDILIPIKLQKLKNFTYFHIGYSIKDPITLITTSPYIGPRKTITHSDSGTSSGTYGPILTSTSLGQTLTPMILKANYAGAISINTGDNIGGAFLYFSQWDYFNVNSIASTVTGWTNGPCYIINYLLYTTNYDLFLTGTTFTYTYKDMKGIVCFTDTGDSVSGAQLSISSSKLPTKWGLTLPGYGSYSTISGNILYKTTNYQNVPLSQQILTPSSIKTPTMGPLLIKSLGKWIIPLPVSIQTDIQIIIIGQSGVNLPFTSSSGTCSIYITNIKMPISCTYTSSPTKIDYILRINQPDLLPQNTNIQLYHYGLSTNSSYNTITCNLSVYTLYTTTTPNTNQLIFYATGIPFLYGTGSDLTYISPSNIVLSSYVQNINNKAAITGFNFSFSVLGKGIYVTNRVRINLGQYFTDNSASQINPTCKIYTYTTLGSPQFNHDWAAIDATQGLNKLQFWPQKNIVSNNLTYTVKCINFIATSTSSATGISGRVVNTSADLTGQISTTTSIPIITLPSMSKINQVSATKKYTIPSSFLQIQFNIGSPGITTDSIMYIGFPSYYSNGLGPSIKCYSTYQIWCKVIDRQLMIRYMGTFVQGSTFIITVTGIEQPINYNSGTFYFIIDDDDNPTSVLSSGTFIDSVSASVLDTQNFPAFQILSFSQSSSYLRQQNVTIILDFYIPSTLTSVTVGQYLFLIFPNNFGDVLRFVTPICILNIRGNTLKNYISSCNVKGLRIKMPFLDSLTLGSVYSLTINGIINPTNPSSNVYKYALQITSSSTNTIIARTFSPHANFNMPIFIINPIRNSLNYYTADDGLIQQLTTTINIQSKQVFISSSPTYLSASYARNVYLSPLSNLYSFPSNINLLAGQNPYPIRFSALTSGVNYIYFTKNGDGSYYSSLPILILNINKNYFIPVSFIQTSFSLPQAPINTNYTIGLNLPYNLYPMSQVNLTVTLSQILPSPSPAAGITLRNNPTIIKFYPQKTYATIDLYINDATQWTLGRTVNLVVTPMNTNTYAGSATILITASTAVVSVPALTLIQNTTTYKTAVFNVTCSQQGRFIYHVSRQYAYNLTACSMGISLIQQWLQSSSLSSLRVNQVYYKCQDILDMISIITPSTSQQFTITNLKASTSYNIQGYCISQIGTKSNITKISFNTISNGGYVSKLDLRFNTQLTVAQKIKTVCALALLFQVNYMKVSTADGYYCSQLLSARRRLLQIEQQIQQIQQIQYRGEREQDRRIRRDNIVYIQIQDNKQYQINNQYQGNINNREVSSTSTNIQQYQNYIRKQQQQSTTLTHTSSISYTPSLSHTSSRLLTAATTRVQIYFGINTDLISDTTPSTINAKSISQTQIQNQLANVVGLPTLTSISTSTSSYVGPNQLLSIYVDIGPSYVYIHGMTMPHNGLIYIIIGQQILWTRSPVISEIKRGSGPNGLPPVYYKIVAYRTTQPYSSYAAFTGIGKQKLKMYIMASDDNPFDTANFGIIREYSIQAQIPKYEEFRRWIMITMLGSLMIIYGLL